MAFSVLLEKLVANFEMEYVFEKGGNQVITSTFGKKIKNIFLEPN